MPKVGIIIVNYKDYAKKFLADCRDGLEQQSYPKENFKVYLVDNATSQDSQYYLKTNYPKATILTRTDGNYSAANNLGAQKAIKDGCEYLVILNMDVRLDKDWLKELVYAIKSDSNIGIAQSLILLDSQPNLINSLGNELHYLGFGFTNGYRQDISKFKLNNITPINGYASGCSFIISKKLFTKINGYDEELYMYHDDIDISLKVKLLGQKIVLATNSKLWHKYDFTRSINMFYYMERNRYIIILNYYKLTTIILFLPMILFMEIGLLFHSFFSGTFLTKLRIYLYFVNPKTWHYLIGQREKNKKIRLISDRKLFQSYVGKISFTEINNPILQFVVNPITNIYLKICQKIIIW